MSIILNGTTGITTPSVNSDSSEFLVSAPANGGALVLVGNDTGGTEVRLAMQNVTGSEAFRPFNSTSDARFDLGASSRRWKDLYLSGGVYVGGTAAANHLDDYEEGTWTPVLGGFSPVTYSGREGSYIKIGRMVFAFWDFTVSSKSGTGNSRIEGLPFTASSSMAGYSVVQQRSSDLFNANGITYGQLKGFVEKGDTYMAIQVDYSTTTTFANATNVGYNSTGRSTGCVIYESAS